ncbi:DUF3558 family protein [Mycobacterium alsense]|uniref:DUF3558 family protein n=1 Tax=Mycobacterium alsense TaxID=324058 RepID=UPI0009F5B53E|nr:DUF3558 family protein [Mycobacterium alsense]
MEGTVFGRYRLIELLGRGGMGEVWRAFDTTTERVVAMKVLPAHLAGDEVFQQRFRREARAAAGLDEPHVVPIHDFGEIDGRLYVTMRLIAGDDLQTILAAGALSPERAVKIVEQVASALHAAHRIGLIHRDVKPSNILVGEDDFAYLIDFGIARAAGETGLTSTGAAVGTWAYMAPERFRTGQFDARTDVYALACVLVECLTGTKPFPGDNLEQMASGHLFTEPPRPSHSHPGVPAGFDAVIATGMAKDPDRRYPTTRELAAAARSALNGPPVERWEPIPPAHLAPSPWSRQHPASQWAPDASTHTGFAHGWESPGTAPIAYPSDPAVARSPYLPSPGPAPPERPWWRRKTAVSATAAVVTVAIAALVIALSTTGGEPDRTAAPAQPHQTASAAPSAGMFFPECGGITQEVLGRLTGVTNLVASRSSVGCQWLRDGSLYGPHFSFTWFRGSPIAKERTIEELSRASVQDIDIDGHRGLIAIGHDQTIGDNLCEVAIESSSDDFFEWSVAFSEKPYPEPCGIAKELAHQSIAQSRPAPGGAGGTPAPPAAVDYPNLGKDCSTLNDDIAKTVGADAKAIEPTYVGAVCRWQAPVPAGTLNVARYWFKGGSLDIERTVAQFLAYQIEERSVAGVESIVMRENDPNGLCGVASGAGGAVGWWIDPQFPGFDACAGAVKLMEMTLATNP